MTTIAEARWIYWLDEVDKDCSDVVGKKCANLGELTRAGFNVPLGFALSLTAYDKFMKASGALRDIEGCLDSFTADAYDPEHLPKWARLAEELRGITETKIMPADMEATIARYYDDLCRRTGMEDCPVATRSAGPASHPGQYETFLHIRGIAEVLRYIIKVWASTFNQRSLVSRARGSHRLGYDPIGVAILQMVDAKAAGVMFTLNPLTGDRAKIVVEGNWGLGESVVSGSVTPDEWIVDKVVLEIIKRTISRKGLEYVLDPSGRVSPRDISPERRNVPCLTDGEVIELARGGKRIEQHYGMAQDVEWVIDKGRPFPGNVFFVQTRPETVWSQKQQESRLKTSGDVTADVVSFWRNVKA